MPSYPNVGDSSKTKSCTISAKIFLSPAESCFSHLPWLRLKQLPKSRKGKTNAWVAKVLPFPLKQKYNKLLRNKNTFPHSLFPSHRVNSTEGSGAGVNIEAIEAANAWTTIACHNWSIGPNRLYRLRSQHNQPTHSTKAAWFFNNSTEQ